MLHTTSRNNNLLFARIESQRKVSFCISKGNFSQRAQLNGHSNLNWKRESDIVESSPRVVLSTVHLLFYIQRLQYSRLTNCLAVRRKWLFSFRLNTVCRHISWQRDSESLSFVHCTALVSPLWWIQLARNKRNLKQTQFYGWKALRTKSNHLDNQTLVFQFCICPCPLRAILYALHRLHLLSDTIFYFLVCIGLREGWTAKLPQKTLKSPRGPYWMSEVGQ